MEKKVIYVTFSSTKDFRERIGALWASQEEDEVYEFIFMDDETKLEFEKLEKSFQRGNDET